MSQLIRGHCPYCNGPGISNIAKRWSRRELPVKCSLCGGWSHVITSSRSGIPGFTLLIVLAFAVIGAVSQHFVSGSLAGILVALIYNIWAWRRAELWPISPESAANARAVGWVVNALAFLGILGS